MDVPSTTDPGTAPEGRLDNYANKYSPPGQGTAREARYVARAALWKASSLSRCRKCGRVSRHVSGEVGVRARDGHAGFSGLVTCGSVWVCPVCSQKIMSRRSLEIGALVAAAGSEGVPVAFCTLTMRHHRGQSLVQLWDALSKAWKASTNGKYWQAQKASAGLVGFVRVVEVTYGVNGWHVHVHCLMIGTGLGTESGLDGLMVPFWQRWSRSLQRAGLAAPSPAASDWQIVGHHLEGTPLGEYLTKGAGAAGAIGAELTQTQSKVARAVHKTEAHWSLLTHGPVNGEVEGLRLWREWEKGSKGRRQIAWSRGLRERFGIIADKTDDDIVREELGTVDDTVVYITRRGWEHLVRTPALIAQLLTAAETLTPYQLSQWLWDQGIHHRKAQTDAIDA
jgi:hypothetical protein